MRCASLPSVLLALAACGPLELEPVLDADPRFVDAPGARGPFGVAVGELDAPAAARVFVPVGEPAHPRPIAMVFQGGLVDVERYDWLGQHLASKGYVTALPRHVGDLAFFQPGAWRRVHDELQRRADEDAGALAGFLDDRPGVALGHSLGGVVAAKAWLGDPERLRTLVLLASQPDPADDAAARTDGRVLSITGELDLRITPDEVATSAAALAAPTTIAVVDGMNHFQWTEHATAGELATDGEARTTDESARSRALVLVDDALRELEGDAPLVLDDVAAWPYGVSTPADTADGE